MIHCLDTNTCITLLRGTSEALARRFRDLSPDEVALPSMVLAELLLGAQLSRRPAENRQVVETLTAPMRLLPFDREAAAEYASLRSGLQKAGTPIGPNDLVIAATVLAHRGLLITANAAEFSRVPGLRTEDWMRG
jgi:tRNA(fMet)-specific endonuclease VapC